MARRQRGAEADIDLGGTGVVAQGPGGRQDGATHLPGESRPGRPAHLRRHVGRQVDDQPRSPPEQARLLSGLVGAGAYQLVGAVGGEDQQGHPGGVGLCDGGMEVGHGRARGGHHRDGAAHPGQEVGAGGAQGDEPGAALVQGDAQGHLASGLGLFQGVGQRCAAGAGGQDGLADPAGHQGRHNVACGLEGGRTGARGASGRPGRAPRARGPRVSASGARTVGGRAVGATGAHRGIPATALLGSAASRARRSASALIMCTMRMAQREHRFVLAAEAARRSSETWRSLTRSTPL